MTLYKITWKIDIEAESALVAAKEALKIQRDPNSIATMFKLIDKRTGIKFEVDLEEYK